MKKKIFLSLLVVVGLFIITGCNKEEQDELNKQLEGVDNFYLNGGGSNKQNNDESNSQNEPQDNTSSNSNSLLVGIWQSEDDMDDDNGFGKDYYVFNSDGTWQFIEVRVGHRVEEDIRAELNKKIKSVPSQTFTYDGKTLVLKTNDKEKTATVTINGNSFDLSAGWIKYDKVTYTKYR